MLLFEDSGFSSSNILNIQEKLNNFSFIYKGFYKGYYAYVHIKTFCF